MFSGLLRDSVPQLPDQQQGGEPQQRQQRARGDRGGQDGGGDAGHPAGGDEQAGLRHNVKRDMETGAKQHSAEKCQREIAVCQRLHRASYDAWPPSFSADCKPML